MSYNGFNFRGSVDELFDVIISGQAAKRLLLIARGERSMQRASYAECPVQEFKTVIDAGPAVWNDGQFGFERDGSEDDQLNRWIVRG